MRERNVSFKQAVNDAIRAGATPATRRPRFRTQTFSLGPPRLDLDKALQVAGYIEDEAIVQKLALRK